MLEISGLKVVRGSFTVSLPELTVADGQCVALCGVSGSGKSTLMEAMALLTPALEVENFVLDGVAVDELVEKQQQAVRICAIGIMPQTGGLIPYLTIRENLELQIRMALRQQVTPVFDRQTSADGKPCPCYSSGSTVDSAAANSINVVGYSTDNVASSIDEVAAKARAKAREFVSAEGELEVQEQHVEDNRNVRIAAMQMSIPVDSIDAQAAKQLIPLKKRKASAEALVHAELTPEECTAKSVTIHNAETAAEVKSRLQILSPYIARMGLEHHLDKLPEQLSIGQRQRALFLRAIAHKPRLLLMDEPTSSLDPDNASELFTIIEEIAHASGMSVLLITHDSKAASRYTRYVYDAVRSHSDYSVFSFYDEEDDYEDDDVNFYSGRAIDYPSVPHLLKAAYDMQHTKHAAIVQHSISAAHASAAHASADNAGLARSGVSLTGKGSLTSTSGVFSTSSASNMAGSEHIHTSSFAKIGGFSDAISTESGSKDFKSPYPHAGDIIYDHTGHLYSAHGRITYYTTPPDKLKHLPDDKYSNIVSTSSKRGAIKPANHQAEASYSAAADATAPAASTAATAATAASAAAASAASVGTAVGMQSNDSDAHNTTAAHSAAQAAEAVGSAATKAAAASAAATTRSETSGASAAVDQSSVSAAAGQSGACSQGSASTAGGQSSASAAASESNANGAGQDDTGARG